MPSPAPAAGSRPSLPRRIGPGLLLSLAVGAFTLALSHIIPAAFPALVAIVLGTLAANTVLRRPATEKVLLPGLRVSSRTVLRIGIARSEERRVGKEEKRRGSPKKKIQE